MKRNLLILIIIAICGPSYPQVTDSKLYTGATLKYDINKKFRIEFEQQFRFNENISKYDFTFSELGLRYEVFKYLDFKATYRHSFISGDQTGSDISEYDKSRYTVDASSGVRFFDTGLKLSYRIRYQNSWKSSLTETVRYFRNRFELSYNMSKLVDPYVSYENYFRLNGKNEFRQNRYIIGLIWRVSKKLEAETYYIYQHEFNVKNPETDYVIGLGLINIFN